jgi:hypothetical protein
MNGLKHQEKHSMKHYVGLDISVKETSICIIDEAGKICRELKVTSHPEDVLHVLQNPAWNLARVGLEAGPLSQWLFSGLAEAGLPVVCIETRHARAYLNAQVNKTDRARLRQYTAAIRLYVLCSAAIIDLSLRRKTPTWGLLINRVGWKGYWADAFAARSIKRATSSGLER